MSGTATAVEPPEILKETFNANTTLRPPSYHHVTHDAIVIVVLSMTGWLDIDFVSEGYNPQTEKFWHNYFIAIDSIAHSLEPVPDEVFPKWPDSGMELTQMLVPTTVEVYVKRPALGLYETLDNRNQLHQLPKMFLAEVQVMEAFRITGLVMEGHAYTLSTYLNEGIWKIDESLFMNALESPIRHLHGPAMNLHPRTFWLPTYWYAIEIHSGTKGWIGGDIKDYAISDKQDDIATLAKIGVWLDEVGLIIVLSPLSTPLILLLTKLNRGFKLEHVSKVAQSFLDPHSTYISRI
ncbi:hypothetical protein I7I51_02885 [Histoplasma capsulatum]|uniref:Uncharacterized protein n=1 Tax=Ajellomyces capsulatus TaxID=5037 RepID=A0A8A1MJL9_AJECA|nr:hypothetical protein I7I51_02885 [Histoplasma capsulatum]